MQLGDFWWDGDKRRIYESPTTGFTVSVDGDGFRVYEPDDIDAEGFSAAAPPVALYEMREDLWSRYVDDMKLTSWAPKAFFKSGGASRGFDRNGGEVFATADFRTIQGWKFVPAHYVHDFILLGNLLDESSNTLAGMFDLVRHSWYVVCSVRAADAFIGYVTAGDTQQTDEIADKVWSHADGTRVADSALGKAVVSPDGSHSTIYKRSDHGVVSHEFDHPDQKTRTPA